MNDTMAAPVTRFSSRAVNYDKYRPAYPASIIFYLEQVIGLRKRFRIADIGSGTGIFSELLLKHGYRVKAIEPNEQMRSIAEKKLNHFSGFDSINGTAEVTGIRDHTIDLLIVAQAFHWFKPLAVKKEFSRILKSPGHTLLIWNILQVNTPFLADYQTLKEKYSIDLKHTHRANINSIRAFFRPQQVITEDFHHKQLLNNEELKGYLLSFSTVPLEDDPAYEAMIDELDQLFQQYSENNLVTMEYETKLYLSKI